MHNVGDAVAPLLVESLTSRPSMLARSAEAPYLLSIGSLLQTSTRNAFVWGTGLIHPDAPIGDLDAAHVLAVRGKLTYANLVRNGIRVRDIPLGDPGTLFARRLATRHAAAARAPHFALGLVPYVFDRAHPFFVAAARDPRVKVLDVCAPVETFFSDLASCEAIASSSLHGLIFGEAFGLPTLWIEVSDQVTGSPFKFADWFSLSENPQRAPVRIDGPMSSHEIAARCEPRPSAMDDASLAHALTADVIEACSRCSEPPRPMMAVSDCRRRRLPVFLVSCDRAESLRRVTAGLRRQAAHVEIVVYDDGSDEPASLAALERLRGAGATVYSRTDCHGATMLDRLNEAIRLFFSDWCEPSRYAVADCTASSAPHVPDDIALYDDVLDAYRRADSAGPATGAIDERDAESVHVTPKPHPGIRRAGAMSYSCAVREGGIGVGFSVYRACTRLTERMASVRVRGSS